MKKVLLIIVVLGLLFLLVFSANFVLLSKLNSSINNSKVVSETNAQIDLKLFDELKKVYKIRNPKYDQIQSKIIKNFKPCALGRNYSEIWDEANAVSIRSDKLSSESSRKVLIPVGGGERNLSAVRHVYV